MAKKNLLSSQIEKIIWLLKHQCLWEGYPDLGIVDTRQKDIVDAMKKDGLVSPNTYWPDVHIGRLINEARKFRREGLKLNDASSETEG